MSYSDDDVAMSSPISSPRGFDVDEKGTLPEGVKKEILTSGSGWEKPKTRYEVLVNLTGKAGESVFDSNESEGKPRTYVVGSGLPCKGLDATFMDMKKGEKAKVTLDVCQAFGDEGLPDKSVPPCKEITYEVELVDWKKVEDLSKRKSGGILVKTEVEGPEWEKPKEGDVVFLRYRGRVQNEDTYFEVEGIGETEPARMCVAAITPPGLKTAIMDMKKGSKVIVTLDAEHAFGNQGITDKCVPAGATVEYEVELSDIHNVVDVSKDGGVLCEILNKHAHEWKKPKETSKCIISYTAALAGEQPWAERQFEEVTNKEILIGASDSPITDGLERALGELVKGQSALVTVRSDYAYGNSGYLDKVKPGESVQYRVELHSFEEAPSTYSMSPSDKKAFTERIKENGNALFKSGAIVRALRRYQAALDPFEYIDSIKDEEEKKAAQEIKAACLLNIAACYEKLGEWNQVVSKCNKVLELPFGHVKSRFRRAKAYMQLGRLQEARSEVEKLLETDPNDKALISMAVNIRKLQKDQDARAKQIFGKMFRSPETSTAAPASA